MTTQGANGRGFEVVDADAAGVTDDELLAVLSAGYDRPFTRPWIEWKHDSSPWGRSRRVVARDDEGLLGVVFGLPWRFRLPAGAVVDGLRLVDGATTPRAVRRGVFGAICRELIGPWVGTSGRGIVIATATPAAQAAHVKNGAVALTPIAITLAPVMPRPARLIDADEALRGFSTTGVAAGGLATGWNAAAVRWRVDDRSGADYVAGSLTNVDGPNGLIARVAGHHGVRVLHVTATWGDPACRARLVSAMAWTHRAALVAGPTGPGTADPPRRFARARGTSLLCAWDSSATPILRIDCLDSWRLDGLDLEGFI